MGRVAKITRRTLLIGSAAVAGGVAFGYWKYKTPYDNPLLANLDKGEAALTPYVRIDQKGVTIITPRAEMGQGVHTTLAALVAEELDVEWDAIRVEHGPASEAYYNGALLEEGAMFPQTDTSWKAELMREMTHIPAKFLGMQITGGSSTTPDAYVKMRVAGAAARQVLLQAAADRLDVDVSTLRTQEGKVVAADGMTLSYSELAVAAADITPPRKPQLKSKSEWKLLGKSLPRIDVVSKSTGTAEYSIDVKLPDMLFASVRSSPRLGGAMNAYDASDAEQMPGVKKIVTLDDGVAVVATNTWYAFKAVNAIRFDWADAPYPGSTKSIFSKLEASFDEDMQDSRFRDDGDTDKAFVEADILQAEYRAPFLAHATMEPMNATALLKNGRLDVWAGTQAPTQAKKEAAAISGLDSENIFVHTTLMGGGFGRRAEMDFIKQAIHVAKELEGTPVKLTWTREEDMTHDAYRPAAIARYRATVANGVPTGLDLELSTVSVFESQMGRIGMTIPGPDSSIVQAAWDQPYSIPNYRVTGYRAPVMLPVGSWRSVGASQNGFFHESIIDELAHAAGTDPLDMRLQLIDHEPSRNVVEAVATMSKWGEPLPEGHGRGVAFVLSFGVPVAEVIEVVESDKGIKIVGVWAAVDVGTALDPRNIEAQVQSGINFGLAAAMTGEITVDDGKIQQNNFHTYNSIRMNQAPPITVRIFEHGEKIRGIGEPGLPPAAPALANAIFAATGRRIRELPLNKHVRFA
ncbi:MAG: xanthine dehydrogenase family protein molybdopterin-binding subunit [Woeseiaceae bacterium]|nr:xanthine dehydrogenase family protein molybdopterin-binding subunit [Woeseiaceae bacterium]